MGCRANFSAAAAIAAAVIVVVGTAAQAAVIAAAAEQDQQDDDPPDVTAAERIVAHKITSEFGFEWLCRSFHVIPWPRFCAEGN